MKLLFVAAAAAFQWSAVVALRVASFGRFCRALDAVTRVHATRSPADRALLETVSWAVRTSSVLFVPVASCLSEAVAAVALMRWLGGEATLRFGVQPPAADRLAAHAWAVSGEQVIVGGETRAWIELPARSV